MANPTERATAIQLNNPGPLDSWEGPYNSIAEACAKIKNIEVLQDGVLVNFRLGKKALIRTNGKLAPYWWPNGSYLDGDIEELFAGSISKTDPVIIPSWFDARKSVKNFDSNISSSYKAIKDIWFDFPQGKPTMPDGSNWDSDNWEVLITLLAISPSPNRIFVIVADKTGLGVEGTNIFTFSIPNNFDENSLSKAVSTKTINGKTVTVSVVIDLRLLEADTVTGVAFNLGVTNAARKLKVMKSVRPVFADYDSYIQNIATQQAINNRNLVIPGGSLLVTGASTGFKEGQFAKWSTGQIFNNAGYNYIEINTGPGVKLQYIGSYQNDAGIAFIDAKGVYISGVGVAVGTTTNVEFVTPSNTIKALVSIAVNSMANFRVVALEGVSYVSQETRSRLIVEAGLETQIAQNANGLAVAPQTVYNSLKNQLIGKNLIENYRFTGQNTVPDNYSFYQATQGGATNQRVENDNAPSGQLSYMFSFDKSIGGTDAVFSYVWPDVIAANLAGKTLRLGFYIKADKAITVGLRFGKGATSANRFTNAFDQTKLNQYQFIEYPFDMEIPVFTGNLTIGAYIQIPAATTGLVNIAISGFVVKDIKEIGTGKMTGFELNDVYEEKLRVSAIVPANIDNTYISIPDEITAIVGDTLEVFRCSIVKGILFNKYELFADGVNGVNPYGFFTGRKYEFTPDNPNYNFGLRLSVKNDRNEIVASKVVTIKSKAKGISPGAEKTVLQTGDSFTANQTIVSELKRRLTGTGGTPAADGLTNLKWIGTVGAIPDAKHEGRSGQDYAWFLTAASPFWNPALGRIDFNNYCAVNGFSGIDFMTLILGTNSGGLTPSDTIRTFWRQLITDYPAVKVLVGGKITNNPTTPNANYSLRDARQGFINTQIAAFDYNKRIEALTKEAEFAGNFFYVEILSTFDIEHNFPHALVDANLRNSADKVLKGTDNVHPSTSGYLQIADTLWRGFHQHILS